jgi:hypothetical protein
MKRGDGERWEKWRDEGERVICEARSWSRKNEGIKINK